MLDLSNYKLILASNSPRRKQFLQDLGLSFEVRTKDVDEIYPENLAKEAITNYLAKLKAKPLLESLAPNEILITSDTIVWHNNEALGKPIDYDDAFAMLSSLSGATHEVISSISLTTTKTQVTKSAITKVTFRVLTEAEIHYYLKNYKPFDKAGSYGIQEWIGYIAITEISGSYNNVVGLPTHLLHKMLTDVITKKE